VNQLSKPALARPKLAKDLDQLKQLEELHQIYMLH
jgi:hypothetical protein